MDSSFQELFQAIATAQTEQELRFRFMDRASNLFGVQRWGIYLLDRHNHLADFDVHGVSDAFVERYEKLGRAVDPVMNYVLRHHAPAHEELVLPNGAWKQSDLYQRCCAEYAHEHIMTGPIVGYGQLIGTIHFARVGDVSAFGFRELFNLSAVCSHLSACLAHLRTESELPRNRFMQRLTVRELQIADRVAQGLTNAAIGRELWITENSVKQALKRMFRKTEVSTRTELVAKLKSRD